MKNTIIILLLFCSSLAYSYNDPIKMSLNKKYYESWANYHLDHIAYKYYFAVVNNKGPIFSDAKMSVQVSQKQIDEKTTQPKDIEISINPTDPFGPMRDSTFVARLDYYYFFTKVAYYIKGDSIDAVGVYINTAQPNRKCIPGNAPTFYIKWKHISYMFDDEEKLVIQMLLKYKMGKNVLSQVNIEWSDSKGFSAFTNSYMESKLFNATRNAKLPVYISDSLKTQTTYNDIDKSLTAEMILAIPEDSLDLFGPSHDSTIYVKYNHKDNDTSDFAAIRLIWFPQKEGGLKLIAAAPLFIPQQFLMVNIKTAIPFGYIKSDDFKLIYTKDEEKMFNLVAWHAMYVNADGYGYNQDVFDKREEYPPATK